MLFKAKHVEPILLRQKRQTRRFNLAYVVKPPRSTVATTGYSKAGQFARIFVNRSWVEKLADISPEDCAKECCSSREEYFELLAEVNHRKLSELDLGQLVRVYDFEAIAVPCPNGDEPRCACRGSGWIPWTQSEWPQKARLAATGDLRDVR